MITKFFAGEEVFDWWIGVVESRQDPLELGRLQVRIYAVHNPSLTEVPSLLLPWASCVRPVTNKSFGTPKESEVVCGWFLDGPCRQMPIVWGVIEGIAANPPSTGIGFNDLRTHATIALAPKIPLSRKYNTDGSGIVVTEVNTADPSVLESLRHPNANELGFPSITGVSRNQDLANTVIQARKTNLDTGVLTANGVTWSEPYPAYNPEYPYDQVTETESGHIFELDDTPGSERIQIAHRTGSFIEWYPSGTKVEKVTKSNYSIVMGDDHIHVMGRCMISVAGDTYIRVAGDVILEGGHKVTVNAAGDVDFSVGGNFNVKAKNINLTADDDITVFSDTQHFTSSSETDIMSNQTNIESEGDLNLLSSGGAALLTGLTMAGCYSDFGAAFLQGLSASAQQGGMRASGASTGDSNGLPAGIAPLTRATGQARSEAVPVPLTITQLITSKTLVDPLSGYAYSKQQFLQMSANNTLVTPDSGMSVIPTNPCLFDPTTHTLISDPTQWNISSTGLNLIKSQEGFAKVVNADLVTAYLDPSGIPGLYAIGYGTTQAALGQPITLGTTITRAVADQYLQTCISDTFLPALQQYVTVGLTQNMIDSLLDFLYNVGVPNFAMSTLLKRINAQQWCGAGDAMLVWNKTNHATVVSQVLTRRRQAERIMFLT